MMALGSFTHYATIGSDLDNHVAIRVGDLDNDGAPDAVVGNWGGSPSKVYMGVSEASLDAAVGITVTPVNDAPVLTPSGPSLGTITEDSFLTYNVSDFAGQISDVDAAAAQGIAICGLVGNGTWEYPWMGLRGTSSVW